MVFPAHFALMTHLTAQEIPVVVPKRQYVLLVAQESLVITVPVASRTGLISTTHMTSAVAQKYSLCVLEVFNWYMVRAVDRVLTANNISCAIRVLKNDEKERNDRTRNCAMRAVPKIYYSE